MTFELACNNATPLLAYEVGDGHFSKVVFASDTAHARYLGGAALGLEIREIHEIHRRTNFDRYASTGEVPARVLLDAGWWLECPVCSDKFHTEGAFLDESLRDRAWCSEHCFQEEAQGEEALTAEARLRAEMLRFIRQRWPGVVVGETKVRADGGKEALAFLRPSHADSTTDWVTFDYTAKTLVIPIELITDWGDYESSIRRPTLEAASTTATSPVGALPDADHMSQATTKQVASSALTYARGMTTCTSREGCRHGG